jgi:hypothetical protein
VLEAQVCVKRRQQLLRTMQRQREDSGTASLQTRPAAVPPRGASWKPGTTNHLWLVPGLNLLGFDLADKNSLGDSTRSSDW